MKRALNVYEEELPELLGKLLSVNAVLPKELKKYLLKLLGEEVRKKGEVEVVEELFETNYGEEWEKAVGRRLEVIEMLLPKEERKERRGQAEVRGEKSQEVKSIADKFRSLG